MTNDNSRIQKRARCAFTLTEVIIVLVIIAALALVLVPNIMKAMPDDHSIKYKKAFYTIQEIVSDIANDPSVCTGLDDAENPISDDIFLSSCRGNLRNAISSRLNTTTENDVDNDIQTTNGMRWFIPNINFASFVSAGDPQNQTITVSLDNRAPINEHGFAATASEDEGIFEIIISADGKVIPGRDANEQNLLLNNPAN